MVPFAPPQIPFFGRPSSGLLGPDGRPLQPWITPDTPGSDGFRGDGFALPHVYQFSAILSGAQKTYFHDRWDEARKNSRENAQAMERDAFLQGLLQERKLATATLKWHIEVDDEKDPFQKALKDGMQRILSDTPYLIRHHYACLDAIWYGRHGVQRKYDWKEIDLPAVNFQPAVPGMGAGLAQGMGSLPGSSGKPPLGQPAPGRVPGRFEHFGNESALPGSPAARGAPAVVTTRSQRRRCQVVTKHQPVHGDSIGHKWDGTPYVLLYSPEGKLYQEQGAEITLTTAGSYGLVLREPFWRDRFVLHTHESVAAEFFDPERAEAIHGCGVRDRLYWLDWLKREFLEWIVSFFERVGLGTTIWYYEAGNKASFEEVQAAAQDQSRRANIFVPQYPARTGPGVGGMERLETPVAGAEAMLAMITHLEEIQERYIIGQTGSSRSDAKGLGTHDTSFQRDTKYQLIKYDAENLADTYSRQWVEQVKRASFPDMADIPARWKFNVPDPEAESKLEAVSKAISFGVEFKKDEVRSLTGLSDPEPGDDIVGGMANPAMPRDGDGDGIVNEKDNPGISERGRPGASSPPPGGGPGKSGQFGPQGATPPQGGPNRQERDRDVLRYNVTDASGHEHDDLGLFTGPGETASPLPGRQPDQSKTKQPKSTRDHPGAAHGSSVKVQPSDQRAFDGSTPVKTKTTLTKQETGRVGEAVVLAYLRGVRDLPDARPMNTSKTNFPIDLIEDHAPTEVKAGLVSNGVDAQKWRLTFSKETAAEKTAYANMTPKQREAWNVEKQQRIRERKQGVVDALEKETGVKIKPRTMTVVINPDTQTADIYSFDGWHDIIRWRSADAQAAYVGSVTYS